MMLIVNFKSIGRSSDGSKKSALPLCLQIGSLSALFCRVLQSMVIATAGGQIQEQSVEPERVMAGLALSWIERRVSRRGFEPT